MEPEWTTPPPLDTKHGRLLEFVGKLKERPGEWALYPISMAQRSGAVPFRRLGCEATTRKRDDGRFDVYVRWPSNP